MNHNVIFLLDALKMSRNMVHAQSPSFSTVKEGDLPLLRFSNLTCMDSPILEFAQSQIFLQNPLYIIQLAVLNSPSGQRAKWATINLGENYLCIQYHFTHLKTHSNRSSLKTHSHLQQMMNILRYCFARLHNLILLITFI